jgi:hypothetical protein
MAYAFECAKCNRGTNKLVYKNERNSRLYPEGIISICPQCAAGDPVQGTSASIMESQLDTKFKPHFDGQLNKFFGSVDEKKKYLTEKGYTQVSGCMSPQESRSGNPHCTRGQYEAAKKKRII